VKRETDLSQPRRSRRRFEWAVDPDAFGQFSERVAHTIGTARFLIIQTILVLVWIALNVAVVALRWDPYPFILLNLMFSVQAAYAAPLILLAQTRQSERDRVESERDRVTGERTQADAEYLSREIASARIALADVVTTEDLRHEMAELRALLEKIQESS
jgi:uncharacterized membrane protein